MRPTASSLTHLLGIQELNFEEKNGSRIGENWTSVYNCFANIHRVKGSRSFELGKISENKSYDITIRYKNDIPFSDENDKILKTKYRLVEYDGNANIKHIFTIHTVDYDEKCDCYKITAFEKR